MEINLTNSNIGNLGLGQGIPDMQGVDAGLSAQDAQKPGTPAFTITNAAASPEDVEAADPKERPDYAYPSLDDVDRIMFGKKVCRRGKSPAGRSEKA